MEHAALSDGEAQYEVLSDGATVWVNGADGMALGRFSRFGMDVHKTFEEQLRGGSQCLLCTHSTPDLQGWEQFRAAMRHHYGVEIDDEHRPGFLSDDADHVPKPQI